VSKIERHALNITPQPVDWPNHVKNLLYDFENYAKEQKVMLTYVEPTDVVPPINIDTLKIDEVLSNLVTNAISYSRTGGHVVVTIEKNGNEVITCVKDDGQGIPEAAIPHLFTKFFRVSGKLEQGSKGTGLGLYISKAIIQLHNGRIWVESEVGKGSMFKFALPIHTS
jgi:signal transduction histidine kinase